MARIPESSLPSRLHPSPSSRIPARMLQNIVHQLSAIDWHSSNHFRPLRLNSSGLSRHDMHRISMSWNLIDTVFRIYVSESVIDNYKPSVPQMHHLINAALHHPQTELNSMRPLTQDPLLTQNLSRLLYIHIPVLFPDRSQALSSFNRVQFAQALSQFYYRSKIWFSARDSLHSILQSVVESNNSFRDHGTTHVYMEMDKILSAHPRFSTLFPLVRQVHSFIVNDFRVSGTLISAEAIKSLYYFVSHFKQPIPNYAIAYDIHAKHCEKFFQRRSTNNTTFTEQVVSDTQPSEFIYKIRNVVRAESFISFHVFGKLVPESLMSFQIDCCYAAPGHLDSVLQVLPSLLEHSDVDALRDVYDWARFVITTQAPSYILYSIQREYSRTYEDALPNISSIPQKIGSAIYKFHLLHSMQSKHFPLWTQFERAVHHSFWTVAKRDLTISHSYVFLLRVVVLFLFGQFEDQNLISEPMVLTILRSIPQLSLDFSEGQRCRFLNFARKTLAERRTWNMHNNRDVAFDSSLRKVYDLERDHIVSFDINTEFSATTSENVLDAFKRYTRHHMPNGDFCWHEKSPSPELTGVTTIEEKDCGIQPKRSQVLHLPAELKELQQYVSSFHRTRYPHRRLSHVNYLSTLVLETSLFSRSRKRSIQIRCNVYQAIVLMLLQNQTRGLSYRRMMERLISRKASREESHYEKLRIRQAVISMSSEDLPLVVKHEGREGRLATFRLNSAFHTKQDLDVVPLYQDSYLNVLDREEEEKLLLTITPVVMDCVAGNRHIPTEALVDKAIKEWMHPQMTKDFIRKVVIKLIRYGRIVLDNQGNLCAAAGIRDFGQFMDD